MIINIPAELELCRYDINKPPNIWNSHRHSCYTQYSGYPNRGKKNKSGFYFFYDSCQTASSFAKAACGDCCRNLYWLTQTTTTGSLTILDFSKCQCLHDMLDIIDTFNIKLYDSQIKINGFEAIWHISDLRNHNRLTRLIPKVSELKEVGWFGQLLTDFDNGQELRKLIQSSSIEIDGYRWCEAYNPYGLTYCIFNCSKLNDPVKQLIWIREQ